MASVTSHLNFGIITSTLYEQLYVVAKHFAALGYVAGGRFSWNIVTS